MVRSFYNHVRRFRRDERGTVAILMGLLLVPLVGAIGIGFEVSNWYRVTRAMQNAADAAVVAAATTYLQRGSRSRRRTIWICEWGQQCDNCKLEFGRMSRRR